MFMCFNETNLPGCVGLHLIQKSGSVIHFYVAITNHIETDRKMGNTLAGRSVCASSMISGLLVGMVM